MTVSKTWLATSRAPRQSHSDISGETVKVSEEFGNGLMAPGDPSMGPEEGANCSCIMFVEGKAVPRGQNMDVPKEFRDVGDYTNYDTMREWASPIDDAFRSGLADDELAAYTRFSSGKNLQEVNEALRAGQTRQFVREMDEFISTKGLQFSEPTTVFRGAANIPLDVGATFTDEAFVYTSVLPQHASAFAARSGGALAEITYPSGARGILGESVMSEGEIIMQRGFEYVVTGVRTESVNFGGVFQEMKIVSMEARYP